MIDTFYPDSEDEIKEEPCCKKEKEEEGGQESNNVDEDI